MYAVQRIYETADRWKKDRTHINSKLHQLQVPFKPRINPKSLGLSTNTTRSRSSRTVRASPDKSFAGSKRPAMTCSMLLDAMQDGDAVLVTEPDYAHNQTLHTEPDRALMTEPDRP